MTQNRKEQQIYGFTTHLFQTIFKVSLFLTFVIALSLIEYAILNTIFVLAIPNNNLYVLIFVVAILVFSYLNITIFPMLWKAIKNWVEEIS
jgi:hypothetical protein